MSTSRGKVLGLAWLVGAIALTVAISYGLPFFAKYIPWSAEERFASYFGTPTGFEVCTGHHKDADAALDKLKARLYPLYPNDKSFPLHIEVLKGSIINAFATLGGQIYIYSGLIKQAESSDELAGILAHEMEHVKQRHIIQGLFVRFLTVGSLRYVFGGVGHTNPEMLAMMLNLRFGREQERDADEGGLQRLKDSHIDVMGFKHFFDRAENMSSLPSIISDHPSGEDRSELTLKYQSANTTPAITADEWKSLKGFCK